MMCDNVGSLVVISLSNYRRIVSVERIIVNMCHNIIFIVYMSPPATLQENVQ